MYDVTSASCATWQNAETLNSILSLKCCITALPDFNHLPAWFIQSCYLQYLQLMLRLLY